MAMKKTKNNFYVVWQGRQTGIADSWETCKRWIEGFPGAKYKGFALLEEAKKALKSGYTHYYNQKPTIIVAKNSEELFRPDRPNPDSISVDAACSNNPGALEYRGVYTGDGQQIFHQGPFPLGTVNLGEFLAIVHGLSYLKKYNLLLPLYSDSRTAIKWVKTKQIKTNLERRDETEELFKLVDRALEWLRNNTWETEILKWETSSWGEIPADFGRK
jgi:ribonuclease HI